MVTANLLIGDDRIGGGFVRIGFEIDGKRLPPGMALSRETILGWRNYRALILNGNIAVYPPKDAECERFALHMGGGRYDVIEGRKLNDHPLTKDEAEAMAFSA
jgi:hypothetical protein